MNVADRPTHGKRGGRNSRSDSTSSLSDVPHNPDFHLNPITTKPDTNETITRNVGSPVLPESPHIESGRSNVQVYSPGNKEKEPGSPLASHPESAGKRAKSIDHPDLASTSKTTTKMGEYQKHESGLSFVLSPGPSTQPLVLTPFLNSSCPSFESEGSSYHSIGGEDRKRDRVKALFAKIDSQPPEWFDVDFDASRSGGAPEETSFKSLVKEEELVKKLSGLTKNDFVVIQERLLDVVQSRMGRVGGGITSTQIALPMMPGSRPFTGQLSAPNLTTPKARTVVRKSLSDPFMTPAAKRKVGRNQTPSLTLGFGQRSRRPRVEAEPFPTGERSSRDSSRRSVTASLSGPPLQLLSRF